MFIIISSLFISGCINNKINTSIPNNQETPQEKNCIAEGGEWKQMNYKADSCIISTWGPAVMRPNCDCGLEKCWNGKECIDDLPVEPGYCEFSDEKGLTTTYKLNEQGCPSIENIYEECENFCYTNQKCEEENKKIDFDIVRPDNNLFEPKCICDCSLSKGWSI